MARRLVPILTDARWQSIEAAAAPYVGSDRARVTVEECLHDYGHLPLDRAQLHIKREGSRRIVDLTRDLATELLAVKRAEPWSDYDPNRPMRDLRAVRIIQYRYETRLEGLDMLATLIKGRRDPPRQWLYWRLLQIWVECFGGPLTVSTPPIGGAPYGPLVHFVMTVTADVLDPPATAHAIKYAADQLKLERRLAKGV
jgi:hypothetical protein